MRGFRDDLVEGHRFVGVQRGCEAGGVVSGEVLDESRAGVMVVWADGSCGGVEVEPGCRMPLVDMMANTIASPCLLQTSDVAFKHAKQKLVRGVNPGHNTLRRVRIDITWPRAAGGLVKLGGQEQCYVGGSRVATCVPGGSGL